MTPFVESRYLAGPMGYRREGPVESPAEVIWNNQTARRVAWERDRAFVQAFWNLHQPAACCNLLEKYEPLCTLGRRAKALGLA